MAKLVLVVLAVLSLGFAATCKATTYTVGDTSGWDISTNLDTWVTDKRFIVGDVLLFQYASTDSVCEVNKESFQVCNSTKVIQCYNTGNTSFPLKYPGDRYFFCGNRLYCYSKMKSHVLVERNQTAETEAEAPTTAEPRAESGGGGSLANNPSSKSNNLYVGLDSILLVFLGFVGIFVMGGLNFYI